MILSRSPLLSPVFRRLYAAQVLSLLGTGLLTAGLSLTAWRLGGAAAAGLMLSAVFALKMVAYVGLAPLAEVALARVWRGPALIGLDLLRLGLLAPLALVDSWPAIAGLSFLFFAATAAFAPLFQALIPEILPERDAYARGLALSRLASTAETLLTPMLVALAIAVMPSRYVFTLAALCFLGSVAALLLARVPATVRPAVRAPLWQRVTKGMAIYLRTPRLRGLFMVNLGLSLGYAWVLVNTVVFAGARLGNANHNYALLMGAFGVGAGAMALVLPRLMARVSERRLTVAGALFFAALTPAILLPLALPGLLVLWAGFGAATSLVLTPGGLVLTRSAAESDRPAVFAAQFSLSHAAWLAAYPLAGWLAGRLGPEPALVALGALGALVTLAGLAIWPAEDPEIRAHSHDDLPPDHPHLAETPGARRHAHVFHIDALHPHWTM
ncbi:MFS transporter [Frigidibacter sp. MR17.14]|uniref:MFS transporter n=1 Tax=Frigidibacter sp. MR17.14 TaxID=3126509 RepID=UPI003012D1D0